MFALPHNPNVFLRVNFIKLSDSCFKTLQQQTKRGKRLKKLKGNAISETEKEVIKCSVNALLVVFISD